VTSEKKKSHRPVASSGNPKARKDFQAEENGEQRKKKKFGIGREKEKKNNEKVLHYGQNVWQKVSSWKEQKRGGLSLEEPGVTPVTQKQKPGLNPGE